MTMVFKNTLFCTRCIKEVVPRVIRTPTFTGEVIVETYCPDCGLLLTRQVKLLKLPTRPISEVKGLYVAIEGIDGSGKTLIAGMVARRLREEGYDVVLVKEPYVKAIKEYLYNHDVDPDAEAFLFAADRIILQKEVIIPALKEGKIVIGDRSLYSTMAFQGARGLPDEFLEAINRSIKYPDVVILLDLPVEIALERIDKRGRARTRFETPEFLKKVRKRFLELANAHGFYVLDATKRPEEIAERIVSIIEKELRKRR